jgi:hypothetical protein
MPILDAAAKDDFRPIFEAFKDDRPFAVVQGNQRRMWNEWRAQFGEFQRLELLGTGVVQGDPAVTVRAHFERGGPVIQLIWGPRRLAGFSAMPGIPPASLVAEAPGVWVYYSYRAPALIRLAFGSGGQVTVDDGTTKTTGRRAR